MDGAVLLGFDIEFPDFGAVPEIDLSKRVDLDLGTNQDSSPKITTMQLRYRT